MICFGAKDVESVHKEARTLHLFHFKITSICSEIEIISSLISAAAIRQLL
jgi:hypothetical protein